MPAYKTYFLLKKRGQSWINNHLWTLQTAQRLIFRQTVQVVIVVLAIFVTFNNLSAQSKQADSYGKTVISSLISATSSQEEIIESEAPAANAKLTSYLESEAFIKNTPKLGSSEDFKMAGSQDGTVASTEEFTEGIETVTITEDDSALIKLMIILTPDENQSRKEIEYYTVQERDNPIVIAQKFGVSVNTILWENNLNDWSSRFLTPGQKLAILPVTGISHTVKTGETLDSIAQKYKADINDIIDFNGLDDAAQIQKDQVLVIPGGAKPYVAPSPKPKPVSQPSQEYVATPSGEYSSYYEWLKNGGCHKFSYGQCTSWVAYKREQENGMCVPKWGDAKSWMARAIKDGYATCTGKNCQPKVGAIIIIRESWYGHVGYVESVSSDKVTFSEMNYLGPYKTSKRTFPIGYWKIIGYIY